MTYDIKLSVFVPREGEPLEFRAELVSDVEADLTGLQAIGSTSLDALKALEECISDLQEPGK